MDFKTAGGWVGDGPHVEINDGVVPNVQLHLIASAAYNSPSIDLSEAHHLLFSAGRSINGPTNFQCYAAYQWTFDNRVFHLGKTSPK